MAQPFMTKSNKIVKKIFILITGGAFEVQIVFAMSLQHHK
jgi:hypothetical protein